MVHLGKIQAIFNVINLPHCCWLWAMASTIKSLRKTHARKGKGAEHWELSSVGTRWTKSTLRACLGLLVEHGYLGKDRYPGGRDGSSQDHSPRTRNSREDFPHSQQLQRRQMGKHPVLDF